MTAVFPDNDQPTEDTGGFDTHEQFKDFTLENLSNIRHNLICRSSNTILKDYEDQNLLRAFPLLFPYGIGERQDSHVSFYQYLNSLSSPNWHKAEFVTIMHNMYERSKMVSAAITYTSKENKMSIGELNEEELDTYIDDYLNKRESNNGPASMFMRKLRSVPVRVTI